MVYYLPPTHDRVDLERPMLFSRHRVLSPSLRCVCHCCQITMQCVAVGIQTVSKRRSTSFLCVCGHHLCTLRFTFSLICESQFCQLRTPKASLHHNVISSGYFRTSNMRPNFTSTYYVHFYFFTYDPTPHRLFSRTFSAIIACFATHPPRSSRLTVTFSKRRCAHYGVIWPFFLF